MFQATRAEKEETRKLVLSVNRAIGGVADEGRVDTWFEREWPELEKKLGAISTVAAAAPPERPEREMVAELLDLSRAAAANDGWSKDALVTLLRGMNRFFGLANEARVPVSAFSGVRGGTPVTGLLSELRDVFAAGTPTAADNVPNIFTPGSASTSGNMAVPQPGLVESPMNEQANDEQQSRRRMHAPGKRGGKRGKTGDEKK